MSHAFINTNGDYMLELHDEILIEANAVSQLKLEHIISDLQDQFAFAIEAETKEGLEEAANSIHWSERWQLTFNDLLGLIKGEHQKDNETVVLLTEGEK